MTASSQRGPSLSSLAAQTPSKRDRYVDFLRGFSILVVVLGHWLIAVVEFRGRSISGRNALDLVPGLWLVTWALQVMPIFFFVGGFSNLVTFEALQRLGEGAGTFLRGRLSRLLRPTIAFLVIWGLAAPLVTRLDLPEGAVHLAWPILIGPLWFLGVYFILVALAPLTVPIHQRMRWKAVVWLGVLVVTVDMVRFIGGVGWVGLLNLVFVWTLVHQLGYFYADGTFESFPRWAFAAAAVAGLAGMIALTGLEVYPGSMVGRPSDEVSNMAPPNLAMAAHAMWQIGLVMALRPAMSRWLARPRPWKAVVLVNSSIMTLFLWHLSALIITAAVLLPLGFPQPVPGTGLWWATRPLWVGALFLVLALLVYLFGRIERPDLDPAERYWDLKDFYAL
jgi:fucose 4-O-acetylase-like acetyltransferase